MRSATPARSHSEDAPVDLAAGSPTSITIVANDIGPVGGMERVLTELVVGLCSRGHDTATFAPGQHHHCAAAMRERLKIAGDRLVAAFVGSEWERKGLRPVIGALALAPEWDLVVAGDGDRARYEQLAESLAVGQAVHWLGITSDVQVVYALADAFVFPSGYET